MAKTPPTKAIAKTTPGGVPKTQADLPKWMQGKAGQGVDRIAPSDVEIPRIILLQAVSPQVEAGMGKMGEFFHTVAEESLGRSIKAVIVYVDLSYILWRPRKQGGGILARAMDGIHWNPPNARFDVVLDNGKTKVTWETKPMVSASGLAEWGSEDPTDPNSPPAATKMYNLVCMFPDLPQYSPAIITLQRSGVKVARKLMGKLKISQAPSYGLVYNVEPFKDRNNQNQEFFNYQFTGDGFVERESDFLIYEAMYKRFREEGVRIRDVEGLQGEGDQVGHEEATNKKYENKM